MMARLRGEEGIAVATAMAVLAIMMAMGLSVIAFSDTQQHASGAERTKESGFNQAEGLLDAQIYQLANAWPATSTGAATATCTPATTGGTCPTGLTSTFGNVDQTGTPPTTCTAPAIAPNPPAQAPLWQTVVQDDDTTSGGMQYYDPTAMTPWTGSPRPSWDSNGNNAVWVRATVWGTACRPQTVVGLASRALKTISWPSSAISADWFTTTNKGNKVIVNTADNKAGAGPSDPPGNVAVRCQGSPPTPGGQCMVFKAGQVAPTVPTSQGNTTPIIDSTELDSLRQQAIQAGMYNATTPCALPANWSTQPTGTVIYVKGGPTCTITALSGNTNALIFVLEDGAISLGGNARFYGLVYDHNASNLTSASQGTDPAVVTLGGCAHIQGLIAVDGYGGVNVGSCKQNIVYDSTVMPYLKAYGGVVISKGSFRTLSGA